MSSQSTNLQISPKLAPLARLAWLALALTSFLFYLWVLIQYHQHNHPAPNYVAEAMTRLGLPAEVYIIVMILADLLYVGAFMAMGAILFWKRGDNPIVYCVSLSMIVVTNVFTGLVFYRTDAPYMPFVLFVDDFLRVLGNSLILLMLYTLPDGRFVAKWTRWAFIASIAYLVLFFATGRYWLPSIDIITRLIVFLSPIFGVQLYRYRHVSTPLQRQQTKWVVLGIILMALAFFLQGIPAQLFFFDGTPEGTIYRLFSLPPRNLLFIALPLGLGFASLRYRLWDVDLTLNRSLVLAGITIVLVLLFGIAFVVAHTLLTMMLPANHEVIAAAIAAAISVAAFSPTRRTVRHFVDRRFYGFRFDLNDLRAAQVRNQASAKKGTYTGKEVEGYSLGNLIGRGGMGEVYEGLNGTHPVAIKALPASYFHDETARRRFEREALATQRLNHPNIVKVLGSGVTEELAYIILEYVTGDDLRSIIHERGALSLEDTLSILRGVAAALDAVHAQGIIHRDLKPSNVMLPIGADGESYHPILMDFGLARLDNSGSTLTGSGAIGTVAYMSPEQFIEARSVDYRADIYALGVMAYEMLAARPPFEGNAGQIMFAHIQQPPPDLREVRTSVPEQVAQAIQKAMAKDSKERFSSASEFVAALIPLAEPSKVPAKL
jgi:tRNA A-37 threonylcarbamoyl transferase component Bud32